MVLSVLVLLMPAVVEAQVVSALVTRGATGQPVRGARVVLLQASIAIDSAESNAAGLVTFFAPVGNGFTVVAHRPGYSPAASETFALTAGSNKFAEIRLVPDRIELDPIEVTADMPVRILELSGFYERQAMGFGSFMTREEIEAVTPRVTTDALRYLRGVSIVSNPGYGLRPCSRGSCSDPPDRRRVVVRMTRVVARLSGGANPCPPLFFLNWILIGNGGSGPFGVVLDGAVNIDAVEGIEVYSASTVPARFNVPGAACGVIVFWTR